MNRSKSKLMREKMTPLKSKLRSQQGLYSVVLVSVISLVFLIVSLNLSKNVQSYTQFETVNKETLLRERAIREIQEHLYDLLACKASFNNGASIESHELKDKNGKVVFALSKDKYQDRGFKEKGLPKARKMTILNCDSSKLKSGSAPSCKTPAFIQDKDSFYHSASTLQIDFEKNFLVDEKNLNNPDNFYPVYIPIYLKTKKKPSSALTHFKKCSTFTPILRNFYCPSMVFELSCCRYIYKMELQPKKVNPKISGDIFPAGSKVYSQIKKPKQHSKIIPTADDPKGTKKSADEECQSSAKKAFMSAVCGFSQGWNVHTRCIK